LNDTIVRVEMERTNLSLPNGARLMILRDVIDHIDSSKMALINCSHFVKYPR